MSILKSFAERGGESTEPGGPLHWPGTIEGFPFRGGDIPDFKEDEIDNVPLMVDFHVKIFELWKDEDREAYVQIRDRVANQWYQVVHIDRKYDDEHKNWRVYMEWHQIYGEITNGKAPGVPK